MIVEIRETYSCEIKCSIFIPLKIILYREMFVTVAYQINAYIAHCLMVPKGLAAFEPKN